MFVLDLCVAWLGWMIAAYAVHFDWPPFCVGFFIGFGFLGTAAVVYDIITGRGF